jgi:hypothetical protein
LIRYSVLEERWDMAVSLSTKTHIFLVFCNIGIWTQGLHLKPLH